MNKSGQQSPATQVGTEVNKNRAHKPASIQTGGQGVGSRANSTKNDKK